MNIVVIPLNASSFDKLNCDVNYRLTVVDGIVPTVEDRVLATGKAIHKYAELRALGQPDSEALMSALQQPGADTAAVMQASTTYDSAKHKPIAHTSGFAIVEVRFDVPYKIITIDDTEYHLHLQGTIDRVNLDHNWVEIIDYKSARSWYFERIEDGYTGAIQFDFYWWVVFTYGRQFLPADIMDIVEKKRLAVRLCAIMLSKKPIEWIYGDRRILTDKEIKLFQGRLDEAIDKIIALWHAPHLAKHNGYFANQCGKCRYKMLCHAKDEHELTSVLKGFTQRPYKPLKW